MKRGILCLVAMVGAMGLMAQPRHFRRMAYVTDSVMLHDPVMAYENGTYYLLSTGMGLSWATSKDRKSWVVQSTPFIEKIPEWTADSVPGFRGHVWAPDVLRWKDRWWLTYSCSTFGKNTSAIGLMSADRLNGHWRDEGCLVASKESAPWNAIDPCMIADGQDGLWMTWGSFWDGIQMAPIDETDGHLTLKLAQTKTIARRYARGKESKEPNPTSQYAGPNAIEAPFIMKRGDWYYLFVSWDYCCRGAKSNYRVAVGRSRTVDGPYVDKQGVSMTNGGGTLILEGDKQEFEAAGHCAAYHWEGEDVFICHGYSVALRGASLLIEKRIEWTNDNWPILK